MVFIQLNSVTALLVTYESKLWFCNFLSSDRSLILWKLVRDETNFGIPQKRLHGHSHFVSDTVISSDGHFALSCSWDKTLRLWDLTKGVSTRQFVDHNKVCKLNLDSCLSSDPC